MGVPRKFGPRVPREVVWKLWSHVGRKSAPNIAGGVARIVAGDVTRQGAWKFRSQMGRKSAPNVAGNVARIVAGDVAREGAWKFGSQMARLEVWPGSFDPKWGGKAPLMLLAMWP